MLTKKGNERFRKSIYWNAEKHAVLRKAFEKYEPLRPQYRRKKMSDDFWEQVAAEVRRASLGKLDPSGNACRRQIQYIKAAAKKEKVELAPTAEPKTVIEETDKSKVEAVATLNDKILDLLERVVKDNAVQKSALLALAREFESAETISILMGSNGETKTVEPTTEESSIIL